MSRPHEFVMPYAPRDYSQPLADWDEPEEEAIFAAQAERDAWASLERTFSQVRDNPQLLARYST